MIITEKKIKSWSGKFDVSENDNETYFDVNGKRVIIQGGIIINEEQQGETMREITPKGTIKDSGNRRTFTTGAVRDIQEGKGRMDLLPWAAIMEVSKHCENGAKKYGEHNVDKGLPTHSFVDSAMRHLAKYIDGWDDEPHLVAATWNLLFAIQMEKKHPELCDIPWDK